MQKKLEEIMEITDREIRSTKEDVKKLSMNGRDACNIFKECRTVECASRAAATNTERNSKNCDTLATEMELQRKKIQDLLW